MVRCGQLTSKECLRFIFSKLEKIPRVYNDAVNGKHDVLVDEMDKFSKTNGLAFWSNVVHNKACQKCLVTSVQNLPRPYEMPFILDEYAPTMKRLARILRNIFLRIISQKEVEDPKNLNLSSFFDLYLISDLSSCFGHIPSFKKGLGILVNRMSDLPTKVIDYEVMANSALSEVINRFKVFDKLNNKGLTDLYVTGMDIINSISSLANIDRNIATILTEPFEDAESKTELFILVRIVDLYDLISKNLSSQAHELFYYQVGSKYFALKFAEDIFKKRFVDQILSEEDSHLFLLLSHALLNHKTFLKDLTSYVSLLDIMLNMKSTYPKLVKDDQVKWFMEDAQPPSEVKLSSEGIQVREIYPDLGSGFISKLLAYYKNNVQEIMIALLEENLPPQLCGLDRKAELKIEPEKPKLSIPGLYHKKAKTKRRDERLEEEEQQFIKKIAKNYRYVEEVQIMEVYEDDTGAKYDVSRVYGDEYDDTYDDDVERVEYDPLKPDDLKIDSDLHKNINHQAVVQRRSKPATALEAEAASSTSEDSRPTSRSEKVSAPVSAKAYYSKVWTEKDSEGSAPRNRSGPLNEESSVRDKRHRDVNKARFANHNRKKMAAKKQSRGMGSEL